MSETHGVGKTDRFPEFLILRFCALASFPLGLSKGHATAPLDWSQRLSSIANFCFFWAMPKEGPSGRTRPRRDRARTLECFVIIRETKNLNGWPRFLSMQYSVASVTNPTSSGQNRQTEDDPDLKGCRTRLTSPCVRSCTPGFEVGGSGYHKRGPDLHEMWRSNNYNNLLGSVFPLEAMPHLLRSTDYGPTRTMHALA